MTVSGEIRNQHGIVSERKEARVQAPEGMIEGAAVQEDDHRFLIIEGFATVCGKNLFAVYSEVHV